MGLLPAGTVDRVDIAGMGNPLLDLTVEVDDEMLVRLSLEKGKMHLVEHAHGKEIVAQLNGKPMVSTPGGSAANTMADVCMLGGSAVFVGKIGDDDYGTIYEQKTKECGVVSRLAHLQHGMTGYAITFITPDKERTFAVYLGAAAQLKKEDIDQHVIAQAKALHIEGFQLEDPNLRAAVIHAMQTAKDSGVKIAIDLADAWMIRRNLETFTDIVKEYADIVFVNETEAKAFTGQEEEAALNIIAEMCDVAIVKLGEHGSLIKNGGAVHRIPVTRTTVMNTNGAGDMYAAGFLYAYMNGTPIEKAGAIASYAAAQVVASAGARLELERLPLIQQDIKKILVNQMQTR